MDIAQLGIRIDSDGVPRATRGLRDFEGQSVRAEKATDGLSRAFRVLGPLIGAVTAAFSIRALTQYADAWSDMQSRVGAAIKDMDAAPAMMKRMVDMANASYSPLEQTVEVYARNVGTLRDLGYAADGAADFTEALNHALVITATRGERASSVQNALSKAMATGKLQADGLESVLANGGRVAEALAAELGTTVSGLRALASEGEITGDVIARALTGRLQELRGEAAEMPATITDAFTRINTNMLEYVGTVDKAMGISGAFAETLLGVADSIRGMAEPTIFLLTGLSSNFEQMAWWAGSAATVVGVQYVASMGLASVATGVLSGALTVLRGAIIGTGIGVLVIILGDVAMKMYGAATATDELGESIEGVTQPANTLFTFLKNGAEATAATFDWLTSGISAGFVGAFATVYENYANLVNGIRAGAEALGISGMIGMTEGDDMNPKWATGVYNDLRDQTAAAGDLAGKRWAAAFGARVPELVDVNGIVGGLDGQTFDNPDDMWASLRGANDEATSLAPALDSVGKSAAAANDNALTLGTTLTDAARAAAQEWEFYRGTFNNFFSDLSQGLKSGEGFWQSFGNAVSNVLDNIANRLMGMASNGLFDMLFGAVAGGLGGMGSGMAGTSSITGSSGGFFPGFDGGGYTGSGSRSGGIDGMGGFPAILHPQETVIDHTRPAANQNQANDNRPNFSPVFHINGSNLSQAEMQQTIEDALENYRRFQFHSDWETHESDRMARG